MSSIPCPQLSRSVESLLVIVAANWQKVVARNYIWIAESPLPEISVGCARNFLEMCPNFFEGLPEMLTEMLTESCAEIVQIVDRIVYRIAFRIVCRTQDH